MVQYIVHFGLSTFSAYVIREALFKLSKYVIPVIFYLLFIKKKKKISLGGGMVVQQTALPPHSSRIHSWFDPELTSLSGGDFHACSPCGMPVGRLV